MPRIPAGRWILRLEPESEAGKAPPSFRVRLTSGVPHVSHLALVILFLFLVPTLLVLSKFAFEGRRWAESDFTSAGGELESDDSDDK